jgi:RNA polymerase sigma-70 factor (TIGR02943 family)
MTGGSASTPGQHDPQRWLADHGDALYRYALLRVSDRNAAEDIVQETFLSAWRARETFEERASQRTWLIGVLRHKLGDHARARRRNAALPAAEAAPAQFTRRGKWLEKPVSWRLPEDAASAAEFQQILWKCIAELPEMQRIAFVLREIDGLETTGICDILQLTPTNLSTLLHRARMQLRHELEVRWFKNRQP